MVNALIKDLLEILEQSGCHRLPERSFFYKGKQFPVCARCTGVIFGQYISLLLMSGLYLLGFRLSKEMFILLFFFACFMMLPMLIDWVIQEYFCVVSNNRRRLITGFSCGLGAGIVYFSLIFFAIEKGTAFI
jgi:uncharacterized membrane protein